MTMLVAKLTATATNNARLESASAKPVTILTVQGNAYKVSEINRTEKLSKFIGR